MTQIDKAEAHDDDLIRRGDARAAVQAAYDDSDFEPDLADADARIAALPARGVGVKPLVWREMRTPTEVEAYYAQSLIGRYKAQKSPTVDYAICVTPDGSITRHPTLEAAKAAAQTDYEARILAALAPTDAAQVREAALREAAKVGADAAFNYWAEAEKPVSQRKYGGAGLPASVSLAILTLIGDSK